MHEGEKDDEGEEGEEGEGGATSLTLDDILHQFPV